ncbi:hypothetical protein KP509_12G021100 [Ceratopteris richardii]|nr:hypothetical protein KP509_12G021100 [Ceratopteris richardii]
MNLKTGLLGTIAHDIGSGSIISASNTTPDALSLQFYLASMLANNAKACVMEVSSHALAQGRCIALDFDLAVFTNLTRDHMDFHKTEERYKESKAILFAMMVDPLRHRKIVNADDPHAPYFLEQGNPSVPVLKFSLNNRDADVYASNVVLSLFKTQFIAHTNAGSMRITSNLLGKHNVYNILAAIAVGIAANIPLSVIAAGVEAVDVVPGRCEVLKQGQNFVVLVDYAHTPDALARLLDTVRDCGAERVITVIGCGGDRDKGKRPIMAKIAAEKSEICILTSDNPRTEDPWSIINEMLTGIGMTLEDHLEQDTRNGILMLDPAQRLIICEDRRKAIKLAISKGKEGDAVIVAGKGHENYQILGNRKEHFDDREECQRALQDLITNAYHASQE